MKQNRKKRRRATRAATRYRVDWYMAEEKARARTEAKSQLHAGKRAALRAAADKYLGLKIEVREASEGIGFVHKGSAVAFMWDAKAATRDGTQRIHGDFLQSGPHWAELRALLLRLTTGQEQELQERIALESLPQSLSDDKLAVALEASERIRSARWRAFACPVVVDCSSAQLRFDPIRAHADTVEVPFQFRREGAASFDAAFRLDALDDHPLPLVLPEATYEATDEGELIRAWVIALAAFAELSCSKAEESRTQISTRQRNPRGAGSPRRRSPSSRGPRGRHRGRLSRSMIPVGETAQYAASYVSGHRRRLRSGRCCSDDARSAARAVGIRLDASETWVRPHARGLPHDVVLRFRWQIPQQLVSW